VPAISLGVGTFELREVSSFRPLPLEQELLLYENMPFGYWELLCGFEQPTSRTLRHPLSLQILLSLASSAATEPSNPAFGDELRKHIED
jgi:hypothetical protein